jgi:hypothetical protein
MPVSQVTKLYLFIRLPCSDSLLFRQKAERATLCTISDRKATLHFLFYQQIEETADGRAEIVYY